ncbi:hypothetical protein J6590_077308 [Homalodisca vitripennis]|nr:hypothetical protein J6590_077308 [Homalodisca vitripennis]
MSGGCGDCNLPINIKECTKCSGDCESSFHASCLPLDSVKTRGLRKEWFCEQCKKWKNQYSVSGSAKSPESTGVTKEFLVRTLESFKTEVLSEIRASSNELKKFEESLNMFSDVVDRATKLMEETNKRLSAIEKENQQLRENNAELQGQVSELKVRMRNMEQYSRKTNIEISGVPVTNGKNVMSIVEDVGAVVDVEFKEEEVQAAHRVPTFKASRTQPLVVQFSKRTTRDTWLTAYRKSREITAFDINRNFPKRKVFINEHLTPENKGSPQHRGRRCSLLLAVRGLWLTVPHRR